MLLFFIGIVEMFIIAAWTKTVVEDRILVSGVISFVNVLTWYYVLETVVNDISNLNIVFLYAAGCALGTMLASIASSYAKSRKEKEAALDESEPALAAE